MSTPRLFKFLMLDANGLYYTATKDGDVTLTSTETALRTSPRNWDKIRIQYGRDEQSLGVIRTSAVPLEFIQDGAAILRHIYGTGNYDGFCRLIIKKRSDTNNITPWAYETWYDGNIDFSDEYNDSRDFTDNSVSARLIEKGIHQVFEDKKDTYQEIPFDSDARDVYLDGVELQTRIIMGLTEWSKQDADAHLYTPIYYIRTDGDYDIGMGNTVAPEDVTAVAYGAELKYCFTASRDFSGVVNLAGRVEYYNENSSTGSIFLKVYFTIYRGGDFSAPVNSATQLVYTDSPAVAPNNSKTTDLNISYAFDFQEGDLLFITYEMDAASGSFEYDIFTRDGSLTITGRFKNAATTAKSYKYAKFIEKLVSKMTGGTYGVVSTYLNKAVAKADLSKYGNWNNAPSYTNVSSGTAIRRLDDPVIKTKLTEAIQDMWARWGVGYGFEGNNFRFEQMPYFFQKDVVITTLLQVANFRVIPATEWVYNSMKVGYADQNYDKINGRYEINSTQYYKLPNDTPSRETDLVSPYRADVYGIEFVRYDNNDNATKTTDKRQDNDTFLIEVDTTVTNNAYNLLRYPSGTFQGVFSGSTHYNWGLSPHRFVLRHHPYLRSIMNIPDGFGTSGKKVSFQSGLKNVAALTYIDNVVVEEGTDSYPANDNTVRLFKPVIFEFSAQPPDNLLSLIQQNPYGVIRFYNGTELLSGFILDAGITPGDKDVYDFRLLCSPDTSI